ncbi:helix-turn-helix domain-containing protein [Nonomuraea sp. NPDC059007]|uniref:helix-turn-helix domain-containing protein n=1 Tax=Nonomuraea sp. NPDC059007 TaxID=3346692 RepID=UPI0036BF42EA
MVIHGRRLAATGGMVLGDIRFRDARERCRWSPELPETDDGLCLVRSGWFRREESGCREFLDATRGYFAKAGTVERVFGRRCGFTWIRLSPAAFDACVEGAQRKHWLLNVCSGLDLQHRLLLAAVRDRTDSFELAERLLSLLEALPARTERPGPTSWPSTRMAHHALAAAAQEALNCNPSCGLERLGELVGTSPHHLSRVFKKVTGQTLTAYRNELRVRSVLEHLAEGMTDLAELAVLHGFVDQAHMTNVIRRHLADTPARLRRKLSTNLQERRPPRG